MGGVKGRQLQFGSESEEKEQEQGKEEKASEQQEEVAQWYGGGGEAQGVYEEMRAEVGAEREEREREERVEREREEQERETEERKREEAAANSAWLKESMRRVREEDERLMALPTKCAEMREWSRQKSMRSCREWREDKERKQRDGYEAMSREEKVAWLSMNDRMKREERNRMIEEQEKDEREQWKEKWLWKWLWQRRVAEEEREMCEEKERDERQQKELGEMSEREMSVWDDGREMREEVQPFGCASTAK